MSDFVNTLKDLHNGIQLNMNGQKTLVFGTLLAILAENTCSCFYSRYETSPFLQRNSIGIATLTLMKYKLKLLLLSWKKDAQFYIFRDVMI